MKLNYKDFNKMSDKQLRKLPGVGRTTVARIVGFRPFRNNNDLFKVKGLGIKTLKKLGIVKDKRESISEPSPWVLRMRRISERIRREGPEGTMSKYVDNSYMWEEGFKFDWED